MERNQTSKPNRLIALGVALGTVLAYTAARRQKPPHGSVRIGPSNPDPSNARAQPASSQQNFPKAPRGHAGTKIDGPDEGFYDARRGATAYAPIISTFGALALPALVVVFTTSTASQQELALSTGLLAIGVFGSLIGAFGLAAIGAEQDETANIAAAIMYAAVPVALSVFSILGAFEVLALIYIPHSAKPFLFIVAAGSVFGIILTASAVGDAPMLHPHTLTAAEFDDWRRGQWLQDRKMAYRQADCIMWVSVAAPVAAITLRFTGVDITLSGTLINALIYLGIALCFAGGVASALRTKHPPTGNQQRGLRMSEAWLTTLSLAMFSTFVLMILPLSKR